MKLLRSVLYTPGHRADLIEKAPRAGADALCLVLEDSVPEALKDEARTIVGESVPRLARDGQRVLVKINKPGDGSDAGAGAAGGARAGAERELGAIVRPGLAGVIVPGLQRVSELRLVDELLSAAERAAGLDDGAVRMLLLIETPLAAHFAFELAVASPRAIGLLAGTAPAGDMARGLGFQWTAEGLERLYFRSKVLLDARAAGLPHPLDGIYGDVKDVDGLVDEARFARQLGYAGKLVVHPAHVAPVNRVFTPSEEEVARERRVLDAFDRALAEGLAGVVVDGRFVDYAMAATAHQLIARAELAAEADGGRVDDARREAQADDAQGR
ncbi:CoA ester lyase [Conexibacter sp. CPCC 206217]|uniref:HpcH/HpaI aldolase/citrate lyase family protein n=1 Tax=Conexibacter sp. CPCC 206217 TaxID=3064574 RepID=UPI002723CFED|nr:CoA ester lyase [Conexibacter sp. CPCC 206217]MDO8211704.1 CoA ester lyase [Conexibacter sp. CPCC 206217]